MSEFFGLGEEPLRRIRGVFQKHPGISSVILYGSRAKGTHREGSDIDMTIVGPDLGHSDLARIETELDDLLLPWKIDLSLHHEIAQADLLDHISRVGRVIYPEDENR